jgi:hypothetical protein
MAIMELGEHLDALFQCQLLKIEAAITAWATAWQKLQYRHAWSFKPKNLSTSLLGPYECKLK